MRSLFVGRAIEVAGVVDVASSVRAGGGARIVSVEGPAGVGKTTFVRHLLDAVLADGRVVRLSGDELLEDVPFAALHPMVVVPASTGVFEAGLAVLDRWSALAEGPLLVVVVEDLHWADPGTRTALSLAASRLDREPILVVATARPDHDGVGDGWARLRDDRARCMRVRLGELSVAEVADLAAAHGLPLAVDAAERLRWHTGGNALHVSTLLAELPTEALTVSSGPLPAPRTLARAIVARLTALPPDARELVAALAVLNRPTPLPTLSQVAEIANATAAMEAALATTFVEWRRDDDLPTVAFTHPLHRAAVYDDLAPARRRRLHAAAAAVSDRRLALMHRVAAADRADEGLAADLERGAVDVRADDGAVAAARLLRWAADVSSTRDARERRLLAAAHLLIGAEDPASAELRVEVGACAPSPARDLVLGQLAWQEGDVGEAERRLRAVAGSGVGPLAVEALVLLAQQFVTRVRGADAFVAATTALEDGGLDDVLERRAWALRAFGVAHLDGASAGLTLLRERLPGAATETSVPDIGLLSARGTLAGFARRHHDAIADLTVVTHRPSATLQARRRSHVDLALALIAVGRWDEALLNARLSSELSDGTHQWDRAGAHQVMAAVHAGRGQWAEAQLHVDAAAEVAASFATPETWMMARLAAVAMASARDDHETVVAAFPLPLTPPVLSSLPTFHPMAAAFIESGDLIRGAALTEQLAAEARRRDLDVNVEVEDLRGRLAARLGEPDRAVDHFDAALDALTPDVPVLIAGGVHRAYGRLLRSVGRRQQAIEQLRVARGTFERLDATPYVERVDRDLVESGLSRPTKRRDRSPLELTPRERDVVTLAVRGLTNREIAGDLYVSEKAVEYHLRNVYGKLGITSRRELPERFAAS